MEPVLLVHSGGMSSRQWRKLEAELSATHRVVAPDLLGSGDNPLLPDDAPFTWHDDVDVLEKVARGLEEPFHLVGHSYGGLVASALARRHPTSVRSLTLFDPVAFGVLHGANDEVGLRDLDFSPVPIFVDRERGGGAAWFEVFVDYWNGPGTWRAMGEPAQQSFLRVGRKVFREVMSLMEDRTPSSAYAALTMPALLMTGERTPPAAKRVLALLHEVMPRSELVTIGGAGHMAPITHAPAVNALIAKHVRAAS